MFNDLAVDHTPDVHVRPDDIGARGFDTGEERHRRCLMTAMDAHVMSDKIAVGEEVTRPRLC
jgi:hypothetical protein